MVGAQNPNSVLNIPRVDRIPAFQEIIEFTEQFARQRLLGMAAGNLQAAAVHSDADAERLLDGSNVAIVLAEQFREETMVVEVKFQRILVG
jgi:hypothetical protein